MDKKIKVQVPSSSGDYFINISLTDNQNKFLNKLNQIVDKKLINFFDIITDQIANTPEYKNIKDYEIYQLYHDIPGAIWSGGAVNKFLTRFYHQKIKTKN